MTDLRRLETLLLMGNLSFAPPDLCPPNDQFQAIKLTPSYPIVISGHSWDAAVKRAMELLYSVDVSDLQTGSPETASKLSDLSQTLEDLGMHHYSYIVAAWTLQLRRGLYQSDKDMHRRDLASALSQKARALARVGRIEGAIIAARGAVQVCHEDQALQGVQLAKALHVQAMSLCAAGRESEAKAVAVEMVEVLVALGEDKPHLKYFQSLARAFLSDILVGVEEHGEALYMAQAAITSARTLIGVVDSRPALALALLVSARALAARGESGTAYVAGVQAVRHLRNLASERLAFTTFLAHAQLISSRYLHAAGFYYEARKHAEEAVEVVRILHTSAPRTFVRQYAKAAGYLVQLGAADGNIDTELFDTAERARDLFREASIHDSDTLATVLIVIATSHFDAGRLRDAALSAEEAVSIFKGLCTQEPGQYTPPFVGALKLASSCLPGTEGGLEYAKEAVQVHKERKDLERAEHDGILTHLLMDVFSRLRELGREVEAIPWKTEAARLNGNGNIVESPDRPEEGGGSAAQLNGTPGGIFEYRPGSEDDIDDL
jgi:tetratricopeptide (TPR) repeat protein